MTPYSINISAHALKEVKATREYVSFKLLSHETSNKYIQGLFAAIKHLALHGGSVAVSTIPSLIEQYGHLVRTVYYKNTTIIYTLNHNKITIERVIVGSLTV
jgi:hypothetical protein